jgi:hypothetical protein
MDEMIPNLGTTGRTSISLGLACLLPSSDRFDLQSFLGEWMGKVSDKLPESEFFRRSRGYLVMVFYCGYIVFVLCPSLGTDGCGAGPGRLSLGC